MWRFILVSFAFLGWSFYVLSGGADYEPRVNSLQARAKLDNLRPVARPVPVQDVQIAEVAEPASDDDVVTRSLTSLAALDQGQDETFQVVLASVSSSTIDQPVLESDPVKSEDLTATPAIEPDNGAGADTAITAETEPLDIRNVTGSVVNMRDGPSTFYLAIGKLKKGAEVEVLENPGEGWLKIRVTDTGQIGWMADWLVTAAAN